MPSLSRAGSIRAKIFSRVGFKPEAGFYFKIKKWAKMAHSRLNQNELGDIYQKFKLFARRITAKYYLADFA